jgi:prolyl-tRNA editing enzyme YbaK/EbsC (Cys-tRNA(Pro) deacylase)
MKNSPYKIKTTHKFPSLLEKYYFQIDRYNLDFEVVTCIQAAKAKEIPLCQELKTLILETSNGLYAVHLPGNKRLNNRIVKKILGVKQASLASPAILSILGLVPGIVCAIEEPVWSLPQIVSKELFIYKNVSTNDGTRIGYYVFPPKILLEAEKIIVVDTLT